MDIAKLRKKAKQQQTNREHGPGETEQNSPVTADQAQAGRQPAADTGASSRAAIPEAAVQQVEQVRDGTPGGRPAKTDAGAHEKKAPGTATDEPASYAPEHKERELLCFRLGEEEYAIDLSTIKEIIRVKEITPVPNTSDFVLGITVLRGEIIPVIDLRKRIGLPFMKFTPNTRFIIISFEGAITGLVVDTIPSVKRVPVGSVQSADMVGTIDIRFLAGISTSKGGLTVLLKLEEILKQSDMLKV